MPKLIWQGFLRETLVCVFLLAMCAIVIVYVEPHLDAIRSYMGLPLNVSKSVTITPTKWLKPTSMEQ